ncbi:hypothetical protein F5Y10DRAFT_272609 [Nemania abortiva]|nr:hypothetical protein F5Y10DRAFT_272609 [Nemania abortiva]
MTFPTTRDSENTPNLDEFWSVFISEIPRIPSVDEFICRIVGINYPRGIMTDIHGASISPPIDAGIVTKQISLTIKTALELETKFWTKQLRENQLYTPYAWALRLNSNIGIKEAEIQILEALEYVGNIERLDALFWQAFRRTLSLRQGDGRKLKYPLVFDGILPPNIFLNCP